MKGLKFGECELEMTLPELAGGRGVVLTGRMKVGRVQFPGEGKTASAPSGGSKAWQMLERSRVASSWLDGSWTATRLAGLGVLVWWWRRRRAVAKGRLHHSAASIEDERDGTR